MFRYMFGYISQLHTLDTYAKRGYAQLKVLTHSHLGHLGAWTFPHVFGDIPTLQMTSPVYWYLVFACIPDPRNRIECMLFYPHTHSYSQVLCIVPKYPETEISLSYKLEVLVCVPVLRPLQTQETSFPAMQMACLAKHFTLSANWWWCFAKSYPHSTPTPNIVFHSVLPVGIINTMSYVHHVCISYASHYIWLQIAGIASKLRKTFLICIKWLT